MRLVEEVDADEALDRAPRLVRRLLAAAGASGLDTGPPVSLRVPARPRGPRRAGGDAPGRRRVRREGRDERVRLTAPGSTVVAVPGGTYARALHVGPHETLPLTYRGLLVTLHRQGVAAAGPVVERYLDDPAVTPASRLRTEVLHRLP